MEVFKEALTHESIPQIGNSLEKKIGGWFFLPFEHGRHESDSNAMK